MLTPLFLFEIFISYMDFGRFLLVNRSNEMQFQMQVHGCGRGAMGRFHIRFSPAR